VSGLKGVSTIVATAVLLSITIAGAVLIYNVVASYLNSIGEGKLIVHNAYYINATKTLYVTVENVGGREARITAVRIIDLNNAETTFSTTASVPSGGARTINITNVTSTPRYIMILYNNVVTEPIAVRVI
jgi:FlaG/FlaF family flagellin (archaellin)